MKRVLLFSAMAPLVGAILLHLLQFDPGYVLIVIGGKSVEMRFWFAFLLLCILVVVAYYGLHGVRSFVRFMRNGWSNVRTGKSQRGQRRLSEGLLHMLLQDHKGADRFFKKAQRLLPNDPLATVAISENALQLGQFERAHDLLQRAVDSAGRSLALSQAEVRLLMREGKWQEAQTRLLVLKTKHPTDPTTLFLLQTVLHKLEDWSALEGLFEDLDRYTTNPNIDWQPLKVETYRQLLLLSAEAQDPAQELDAVWSRVPKVYRDKPELLAVYCRLMIGQDRNEGLEAVLRKAIKHQWSEELVELYGILDADPSKQLRTAEAWLSEHPNDAVLNLALGRIAMNNHLWGRAREFFEQSMRLSPTPIVHAELARLLEKLGEAKLSQEIYRQGLLFVTPRLPSLPTPDKVQKTHQVAR